MKLPWCVIVGVLCCKFKELVQVVFLFFFLLIVFRVSILN